MGIGLVGYFLVVPAAVYVPLQFAGTVNSPAFLPNGPFILLADLRAIYLIQSHSDYPRPPTQGRVRALNWGLAGGTALICIGHIGDNYLFRMTLTSTLYVTATMSYFGERQPWITGPIAIVLPALPRKFFVEFAHILFPAPVLGVTGWLESTLHLAQWFV